MKKIIYFSSLLMGAALYTQAFAYNVARSDNDGSYTHYSIACNDGRYITVTQTSPSSYFTGAASGVFNSMSGAARAGCGE